jgi:dTDP-4-dehydrorhamnose 3,5-epimerase-like enzyme
MITKEAVIEGRKHTDLRGDLIYFNDFDMSPVKRFYTIIFPDIKVMRGWRAHKIEQRWFHCSTGEVIIKIVEIDDWDKPSRLQKVATYQLVAEHPKVLHVPAGLATLIQASTPGTQIFAFGDYHIENSSVDDYTYPQDYFDKKIKK